jgi:phosphoglycolate phosphatase-like HAD superfamily hydrolase
VRAPRQAALFDLDGVLLDSAAAMRAALAGVATCATGRRVRPGDLPPGALRRPRCEVLALLEVTDPDDACDRWWDGAMSATPVELFPGVLTGLLALRAQGTATGAVTLQDPDRLRWLLPPALSELLDVVVTRQDAPAKPAPDGLHAALRRMDVQPEYAVFVGDSPTDMTAARAAGVLALGAVWGWHPPAALRAAGADHLLPEPTSIGPSLLHHLPLVDSA